MQKRMEKVVSRARNDKLLLESISARTSLDYQSNGTMVQDLLTFTAEKCDMQPCPMYGHKGCMYIESMLASIVIMTKGSLRSIINCGNRKVTSMDKS